MVAHECTPTPTIIMLTQTHESGREKCFQYFPQSASSPTLHIAADPHHHDGEITVELVSSRFDDATRATLRTVRLTVGDGEEKEVLHYLFEGWPDFLTPEGANREALLRLVEVSATSAEGVGGKENPFVVHCSAGVGRSGTFIALEFLLRELEAGVFDEWDAASGGDGGRDPVSEVVGLLREQRMMMVQGEGQFYFLYDVLRERWLERHGLPAPSTPATSTRGKKTRR